MANALAYFDTELITAVNGFIEVAPVMVPAADPMITGTPKTVLSARAKTGGVVFLMDSFFCKRTGE